MPYVLLQAKYFLVVPCVHCLLTFYYHYIARVEHAASCCADCADVLTQAVNQSLLQVANSNP